jgi:polyhydroxybutyrate depolymerase
MMAVATPTLAADDGIKVPKTLRTPIETELNFEGRFVRIILPAHLHDAHRRPLPLVLHLHRAVPFPDIADLELDNSGYRGLPGKYDVIVAAPTAAAHPVLSLFLWNITEECCAFPPGTEPDDVGFLNRLLNELLASYPVDPRRVYIYGYSAGAAMAYRLACDSTDRFAAIASGAGQFPVQDPGRCAPSAPISILEVHSLDDEVIPFDGGTFPSNPALEFPGAIDLVEYWADVNGCKGTLQFGQKPRFDFDVDVEGKETTVNRFTRCPKGIDVELWSMEGVDHPPLSFGFGPDGIKTIAKETWKFLRKHKLDDAGEDDDDNE